MKKLVIILPLLLGSTACFSPESEGLALAQAADTHVLVDMFAQPLPILPLPNNLATRTDHDSATGLRVNASIHATTLFESEIRDAIAEIDGWGTFQPISIPFTGPINVQSVIDGHRDKNYDFSDDVIYLIDVDPESVDFGKLHPLDLGNGNFPVILKKTDNYGPNDPRGWINSLMFEEADEDVNGNGILDPGEDTDGDGLLDKPNYYPGADPDRNDYGARADALMTFWEKQTNTLLARVLEPLRERTTYAVIVTRRILDVNDKPIGSAFESINHPSQTEALKPLVENDLLPAGLELSDIAFAFTYTTQSIEAPMKAVRDGLYGHGAQAHLAEEFPPVVDTIETARNFDFFKDQKGFEIENVHIVYGEQWADGLREVGIEILDMEKDTAEYESMMNHLRYVDYFVIGSFLSPQLWDRGNDPKEWPRYNHQRWPADLHAKKAEARAERVYFTLAVPRKEVSARGEGKPAPVSVIGHGYGSSRFTVMQFGGLMAKYGYASIGIDDVSHGISVGVLERAVVNNILSSYGIEPFGNASFMDRAFDQNFDINKQVDSGADFWTAYLPHTRDVVRQSILDHMQLVRVVRAFDGMATWDFDINMDGQKDLAGDFDGDGHIDIGGPDTLMSAVGGSLGGMTSMLLGSLEPEISIIAPISGGAGLGDVGTRSKQGGVVEAFILRAFAPIFTGNLNLDTHKLTFSTTVPNLNQEANYDLAVLSDVNVGDTLVIENLRNGEKGCGFVTGEGKFRAGVAADRNDPIRVLLYGGAKLLGDEECSVIASAEPKSTLDTFEMAVMHQGETFDVGDPLVAIEEGAGMQRGHPSFRRFADFGQLVTDPADPGAFARHLAKEPMTYPGTGDVTGAHSIIITTIGDMAVPASSGMSFGRAAGMINYLDDDPRYGMPVNQKLIETYVAEAVDITGRAEGVADPNVHLDVENFSEGMDVWGDQVPRLDEPLHLGFGETDPLGGQSAAIFPLPEPHGAHGFAFPGEETDIGRDKCRAACAAAGDCATAGCDTLRVWDLGNYLFNMIGFHMQSGGKTIRSGGSDTDDFCMAYDDCAEFPELPENRDISTLP